MQRTALRVAVFFAVAAVAWVVIFLAWGLVVFATGGAEAIKDCQFEEVECKGLGEFSYDATWPLLPLLFALPALLAGWLVARRLR